MLKAEGNQLTENARPLARQLATELTADEIASVSGAGSGKFTKVHASVDVDYGDHTTTD